MKILAAMALLLGLAMMIFALAAYAELDAATKSTSPTGPMTLTKLICPQLVASGQPGASVVDPVVLVRQATNRIYLIGGGSALLIVVGVLILMGRRTSASTNS